MKRRRREYCLRRVVFSFPFHDLIPEMQQETRTRCAPSLCSMLAMTCRQEYNRATTQERTSVLFRLAREGDPHGHLRSIVSRPGFGVTQLKRLSCK